MSKIRANKPGKGSAQDRITRHQGDTDGGDPERERRDRV